jgi:hypothetical protein
MSALESRADVSHFEVIGCRMNKNNAMVKLFINRVEIYKLLRRKIILIVENNHNIA